MPRPTERLYEIDALIREGGYPNVEMFMLKFGISERTANGDIQYLKRRFHAPVGYSRKHGGYYYVKKGWTLFQPRKNTDDKPLPPSAQGRLCAYCQKPLPPHVYWQTLYHPECKKMVYPTRIRTASLICKWCEKPLPEDAHFQQLYHPECKKKRFAWLQSESHKRNYRAKKANK